MKKSQIKKYPLGAQYPGITFTKKQAECMLHFIAGRSIISTAKAMKISPRTVEYYLNNMKVKLNCYSKAELVKKVHATDFMKNIDFTI